MTYNLTMKMVNIYDAKARLSEYLELVQRGEHVVICRRNQPVAELRPVPQAPTAPRPVGGSAIIVPASFFEPLPGDVVDLFYGGGGRARKPKARR